jgi:copper chaperone CopZ
MAIAAHCPLDAKAIDNALAKLDVDADVKTEVEALRDEGMALHNAGNHGEAVATLSQAMRILLASL